MSSALTPSTVEARGQPRQTIPFGFAPRFFIALFLGLFWLIPAWWSPRVIAAMFLWDALTFAGWLFDLSRLPPASQLHAARSWSAPLTLAAPLSVHIHIQNTGRNAVLATVIDDTPPALRDEPPVRTATLLPLQDQQLEYDVLPRARGNLTLGQLFLRYRSSFGFAERWATVPLAQTVSVLPDLLQANEQALYLIRSRQIEMQKRQRRQRGIGREFESLRDYRQGDELRDVSWSATARRHQLISRAYTTERSQTVWIVLDAGRLLRARVPDLATGLPLSKLDYAVNAALSLAQVASQHGDRVGLLAYGRTIQQALTPGRGPLHIRRIVEALAQVAAEPAEADHAHAVRRLLLKQTRRALIIWITDFAETPATPDVIEYATHLGSRNLVLFAAIAQPDLAVVAHDIPQSETAMFRQTAALEIVQRRDLLLRNLRQTGVLALELIPGRVTSSLVNEYLQIKDRNLL